MVSGTFTWVAIVLGMWLLIEIGMRLYLERPLKTGFYSSIPQETIHQRQRQVSVRVADPDAESYCIEQQKGDGWETIGHARFGSFFTRTIRTILASTRGKRIPQRY